MRTSTLLGLVLAASQIGATECGGQVLRDPGFELWCGEALCAWQVERGEIRRAPTWHASDSGIEFVGDDVAIAQLSPVDDSDGSCIQFDLVANVADTAEMFLAIDVEGDGTVERSERIPTASWKPLTYLIRLGPPFDGVRFALVKRGAGAAVLAQIEAELVASAECDGLTPIEAAPRPNGARCNTGLITLEGNGNEQCASGRCSQHECVGCDPADATTCPTASEVCGLADPTSPLLAVPTECVPAGARALGEQCRTTQECAVGGCVYGMCSACDPALPDACANGETCRPSWPTAFGIYTPYVCGAGQAVGETGAPCAADADCVSAHCNGAIREQCSDGRACETAANCPVVSGLTPGPCTTVGIQGGSCE